MTKQNFYDFAIMMADDSNCLYNNSSLHNSVYLGAYVLEAYVKILFIHSGATTPRGQRIDSYGGHINDGKMIERLQSLHPSMFSGSILETNDPNYPSNLLSNQYDINYRYDVTKWNNHTLCENIQNEVTQIQTALNNFRITMGI